MKNRGFIIGARNGGQLVGEIIRVIEWVVGVFHRGGEGIGTFIAAILTVTLLSHMREQCSAVHLRGEDEHIFIVIAGTCGLVEVTRGQEEFNRFHRRGG